MTKKIKVFQKHESPKYKDRIKEEHLDLIDFLMGNRELEYDEIHIPKQIYCEYCQALVENFKLQGKVVIYE